MKGGTSALSDFLRDETTSGKLLLVATAVALLWANLAGDAYRGLWDTVAVLGAIGYTVSLLIAGLATDTRAAEELAAAAVLAASATASIVALALLRRRSRGDV